MEEEIAVIICSCNPQEIYFKQCLQSIEDANKKYKVKEILIIDNNSVPALQEVAYVKDFADRTGNTRIIKETKKGLTPARLRGIKENTGNLIVFIDDDNFIAENFFEAGSKIAKENPHIGAWSGQVKLKFEQHPAAALHPYLGLLVKRDLDKDLWSNFPHLSDTMPCGAGLFVRKHVAKYYSQLHKDGKRNIQLDRSENSLFSGGDNDLAACACDVGMGVGLFQNLVLYHYIPVERTKLNYLLRLAEGIAASDVVLKSFRHLYPDTLSLKNRIANSLRLLFKSNHAKLFHKAVMRCDSMGKSLYLKNSKSQSK